MSTSSLPSFIKIHLVVLEKLKMWKVYGRTTDDDDDGRTDGRTDDGRCAMTIAHSSLRLRWAKNVEQFQCDCCYMPKNKTNHPISSNSHPSASTNKAIHDLKWGGGGGATKPTGKFPVTIQVNDMKTTTDKQTNEIFHLWFSFNYWSVWGTRHLQKLW